MKLYSFTTVKDEEDIIESFVRYNMNILDGMLILDNNSSDSTLEILMKLQKEGYNIEIIKDKSTTYDEVRVKNDLFKHVVKKYKPDYVFPLDADEFIATKQKCNPRKIIEKLNKNKLHLYKMEYFVITKDTGNEQFIPERIKHIRIETNKKDTYYKCIIPKGVYLLNDGEHDNVEIGGHNYHDDNNERPDTNIEDDLYVAHYPIRSSERYANKTINLCLHTLMKYSQQSGVNFHLFIIFNKLLEQGTIPEKYFLDYCKWYDLIENPEKDKYIIGIEEYKLNYSFCKKINIKYTPKENGLMVLKNSLNVSKNIINEMRDDIIKKNSTVDNLQHETDILKEKIELLKKDNKEKEKVINSILNSKWWKLKSVILFWKKK